MSDCDADKIIDELEAKLAAAQELLKTAKCPNRCLNGTIIIGGNIVSPETEQCQWCYERTKAIDAAKDKL